MASGLVLGVGAESDLASARVEVAVSAQVLAPVMGLVQVLELAPALAWGQVSARDRPGAGSQTRVRLQP
jgi:hypothetical protein